MEEMSTPEPQFQNSVDVKLDYLQRDVREIKSDVKDIKTDFISRREFGEALVEVKNLFTPINTTTADHETRLRALESKVWKFIGALVICQIIILPVILFLFFKAINQ